MNTKHIILLAGVVALVALGFLFYPERAAGGGVALGDSTVVEGVTITPLELVEDSRCPIDVQCIQAGQLRLRVAINAMNRDFTLTLGESQEVAPGTSVTLSAVTPQVKYSTVTVSPVDYRFVFVVN
jgi:hypothetical protein